MAEVGSAFVSILPSARGFGRSLDHSVGGEVDSFGKRAGRRMGTAMKVGAVAAIGGFAAIVGTSVKSLARIERINTQTATAIKSTGGAAGVSAKHVEDLAGRLENLTATEAESTQEGANLLLTFTNIRNEAGKGNAVFDRATTTLVDMSRALGQDTKSSAIQLGKALNDPIKGVTALQRVGVSFTAQQKEQITALVDSGKRMEAQKLILRELNKEFGGSGKAFAQTTEGQIELAKHAFGTLGETVTAALLPPLGQAAGFLAKTLNGMAEGFGPFSARLTVIGEQIGASFGTLTPVLQTAGNTFRNVILPAVAGFASYVASSLLPVAQQLAVMFLTRILPGVAAVARFFYGVLYPAVVRIAVAVGQNLKPVFDQLVATFQSSVLPAINRIMDKFVEWWPTIQRVIVVVVKLVGFLLTLAAAILGRVLPPLIRLVGFLLGKVVNAVLSVIDVAVKFIGWLVKVGSAIGTAIGIVERFQSTLINLAHQGIEAVVNAVAALPGKLLALGGRFMEAGRAIIGKFVDGLKNAAGVVGGIAGNVWDAVKSLLNGAISRINSALQFTIHLPGPDISINPPDIPYLAKGTKNFAGGMAVVGEAGPELVILPRGSQVVPNRVAFGGGGTTGTAYSGGSATVHMENVYTFSPRELARETERVQRHAAVLAALP